MACGMKESFVNTSCRPYPYSILIVIYSCSSSADCCDENCLIVMPCAFCCLWAILITDTDTAEQTGSRNRRHNRITSNVFVEPLVPGCLLWCWLHWCLWMLWWDIAWWRFAPQQWLFRDRDVKIEMYKYNQGSKLQHSPAWHGAQPRLIGLADREA
jgi:hypothetical protein